MKNNFRKSIGDVIFILVFIPLAIASIRIVYQKFFEPEKIPDIFGYKMFVVFDDSMDESLEYGDLVITFNEIKDSLKVNSVIAYRNDSDRVTISSKNVNFDKVEGVVVFKIPKLGSILYVICQPFMIIIISCFILLIGEVCIYFAKKIDVKDANMIEKE